MVAQIANSVLNLPSRFSPCLNAIEKSFQIFGLLVGPPADPCIQDSTVLVTDSLHERTIVSLVASRHIHSVVPLVLDMS